MNANRMCGTLTTLAATAVLCCAPAFAQTAESTSSMRDAQPTAQTQNGTPEQNSSMQGSSPNGNMSGMSGKHGKMSGMDSGSSMASMQDKMFLKKAAAGNMAEVAAAKVALDKSSNDQVKQFAQKMIDDHTKMNDQAKPIAQQLNVDLPTEPMAKDQAMVTKMQGMSGADFDKAYMKDMVKDHTKDLQEFKKEASSGKDQQVKDLAQQGSTVIQGHLDMAKQVATSVGAMGGSKMSGSKTGSDTMQH